jgi:hypothetical protein
MKVVSKISPEASLRMMRMSSAWYKGVIYYSSVVLKLNTRYLSLRLRTIYTASVPITRN